MSAFKALVIRPPQEQPWATQREANKVVLGEGTHDAQLLASLLKRLKRTDIQPGSYGGKNRLPSALEYLATASPAGNGGALHTIGITRDADSDFDAALQSVQTALKNANAALSAMSADLPRYSIPDTPGVFADDKDIRVGIFIMPDNESKGMMETLCLRTIADRQEMACVESLFDCLGEIEDWSQRPEHFDKARAHAFLATCNPPDRHPGTACGDSRTEPAWDLGHDALEPLKAFLGQI